MITLTITPVLVERLRREGFFPDTMFTAFVALKALDEGCMPLMDEIDDYSKSRRAVLVYMDLIRKGLWEEQTEGGVLYRLTEKGKAFLTELREIEQGKPMIEDVDTWFDAWMELWPVGIKTGGKLLRSDKKSCLLKMRKFVKDYPNFNRKLIFRATVDYLQDRESNSWAYTKCAIYYISKVNEGSELAAGCERLLDQSKQDTTFPNATSDGFFI